VFKWRLGRLPENCILVTFDVSSLYTNIPHEGGLQAAKEALNNLRPLDEKPSNDCLINLLEFVLTKNTFQFNGDFFLQICGCAMGSKVAPSYANIYLDRFERLFVYTYPKKPVIWLRYLDDCFCIWQHGEAELNKFFFHLNSCNDNIKFTMEKSNKEIPFLDMLVKINDNTIETDLYSKDTDSNNYLLYSSAHPLACKNSIPFSQFLRVRKICTHLRDFDRNAIKLGTHFKRRGYPLPLLERTVLKARRLGRDELIKPKPKPELQSKMERPVSKWKM
jgi:hypothetical protein